MSNQNRKVNGQFSAGNPGKKKSFIPTANPEQAKAMLGLRLSNAAGTHEDTRTQRNRTRSDQNRNSIRDQLGN